MQIPVIITDNRGYRSMIDWLHVLVVAESVGRDEVLIRLNDGLNYSLNLKMSLDEFKKQVEEQLKPPKPDTFWAANPSPSSNFTITPCIARAQSCHLELLRHDRVI